MNIAKNKSRKLKIFWYNFCKKEGGQKKFDRNEILGEIAA